jgi:hypothetical protein
MTMKHRSKPSLSDRLFGQIIDNPRSRAHIGLLAYRAAAEVWDHRDCTNAEVHQWAAGFVHGYLARKRERRGR